MYDECKGVRIQRIDFPAQGVSRKRYDYTVTVEDWNGNRTLSPVLTLRYKPCP